MSGQARLLAVPPARIEELSARRQAREAELVRALRARDVPTQGGIAFVRASAALVDEILWSITEEARALIEKTYGVDARRGAEAIAIVALGGYGRAELCPRSDIDLLFLTAERADEPTKAYVETILYALWDLGYEVGHAARTVSECLAIADEDVSVKTSLIEARLVSREQAAPEAKQRLRDLQAAVGLRYLTRSGAEHFIEQKLEEAERLRARYGNSVYLLEPEVKHGQGGLRDTHTALWIARARWRAGSVKDLLIGGNISPREERAWTRAINFLLRVRTELHLEAKRRRDGLGFEYQEAIAHTLGYTQAEHSEQKRRKLGTERFMRAYYFHAANNRRVSQLVIERASSSRRGRPAPIRKGPAGFKVFEDRLTVSDRFQFRDDPPALMRILQVAQDEGREIYSYTKDLITESLGVAHREWRRHPAVVGSFLSILESASSSGQTLMLMHELGLLRRMIPEWARVTSRWQHSLYHVYTVDVHSIFVVQELKKLRLGGYASTQPELTRLMADVPRPAVLYLAGLLHDVGKGWMRGSHSERGADVARVAGERLERAELPMWTQVETEDLVWLVREHLQMSDTSQRRDLSDPELIRGFADDCRTVDRMTMLYLLTFADMKATSPKVFNAWKGSLLREMYVKGRAALASSDGPSDALSTRRRRAVAAMVSAGVEPDIAESFTEAMPSRYLLSASASRMAAHARAWHEVSTRGGLSVGVRPLKDGVTELSVVCPDRPGLLALLAGTLAANRLSILSAEIFSANDKALDILHVRDLGRRMMPGWSRLKDDLRSVILEGNSVSRLLDDRALGSKLDPRPRPHVETKVVVVPDASQTETVFDVFCQDHLGALASIAQAITEQGLTIRLAKISTQGDRVADGFYVTEAETGRRIEDEARLERAIEGIRVAVDAFVEAHARSDSRA